MTVEVDPPGDTAGTVHPLGHRQRMIWAGQLLDRDVPLYNMAHAFTLGEPVDVAAFERAFEALVDGHDALRAVIEDRGGEPVQRILPPGDAALELVDLRNERDAGAAAEAWVEARARRRFELDRRLYDSALLLVDDETTVWFLNQHHLICDAWSVSLLLGRQDELYRLALTGELAGQAGAEAIAAPSFLDRLDGPPEARPASKGWTRAQAHWQARLDEPVEPLSFYGTRPDDAGVDTVRVEARIEGERARRLAAHLAQPAVAALSPELTALRFFHTVLVTYIHRVCGVDRVVVGTPFHNRTSRRDKRTAGLLMNLYPVVTRVEADDTLASLSAKVGTELFAAMQHAAHPPAAGDENGAFEVVLNYLHVPTEHFGDRPVDDRWVHPGAGDRGHSLRLQVRRLDDGFRLFFDVKTALFDEWARRALVDHVFRLIDGWLDADEGGIDEGDVSEGDPAESGTDGGSSTPIGSLPLASAEEIDELVVDFNRRRAPEPAPTTVTAAATVLDEFRLVAGERPDEVAVRAGDEVVTYAELDRRTRVLATHLVAVGVQPGDIVGLALPRSVEAVVGILGILRAGAGYLPIEPDTPPARLAQMVADTGAKLVCTRGEDAAAITAAGARPVVVADIVDVDVDVDVGAGDGSAPSPADDRAADPEGIAYVIFTSGSTGRPKGVPISHRGLANYVAWARTAYTDDQPRTFALYTSLAFDLTITSIFVPLTGGGTIEIYGTEDEDGTPLVVEVFTDDRVDVVKATPSHLAIVRQLGLRADRLRTLIIGGEDLTTDLAGAIQDLHPRAAIHNEYGPTETVVGCMIHRYDRRVDVDPSVPIGQPGAGAEILVLDRWGNPVPIGVVGEIHIGGPGVAGRYLARPDITAERFLPRPTALPATDASVGTGVGPIYRTGDLGRWRPGTDRPMLDFLGRADDQVKIRGHRIELGEIEAVLAEQTDVEGAAVLVVDGGTDATRDAPVTHCRRCGLPSNYPEATFVDDVCSLCRDYDTYRDKVDAYFRTPDDLTRVAEELLARRETRDRTGGDGSDQGYDCLVLLSGGKDSTYMLYQVVALGLRPLVFTLDNGFISPSALANCRRVCDHLGVDLEIGRTEHMNEIFRDSLDRFSNVCNGCFKTIYTLSMNLARHHGLDHIVTGLARGQLFETRLSDMYDRRIFDVDQIDRFVLEARKAYHQIDDAVSEHLDVSAFADGSIYDEITFVDFYRYVDVGLDEVMGFLADRTPWQRPEDTGRSTNCLINEVGIHVHQRERGFHNYALPYSWDVRLGHKQREAALHELDDDIDEAYVNEVMVEIGYRPKPGPASRRVARLVAHYQGPEPRDDAELRRALADRLPDYMLPTRFVHHAQLPLTVNGKVDRAALASIEDGGPALAPGPAVDLDRLDEAERAAVAALRTVWSWTFDREVDPGDNFFDLGGDSITAIQIVDRAASAGLALTPRQLFEAPTLAATALLAEPLDGAIDGSDHATEAAGTPTPAAVPAPAPAPIDGPRPLTPTQSGMLFHTLAEPASGLYQGQIVHELRGTVDADVLQRCWERLVDRLPALRTVVRWEGLDRAVQEPGPAEPPFVHLDWSGADDGEARLERYLAADRFDRFDLAGDPPVRAALIETATSTVLVWSFHHIALDGWSIALAVDELLTSYQAELDGRPFVPAERRGVDDYLAWLDRADADASERFWRAELAGIDSTTSLPRSRPDPGNDRTGPRPYGAIERHLDGDRTDAIGAFAGRNRVTLSTVLHGAWALVLDRHQVGRATSGTGADGADVVFGVTTSGRPAGLAGAETMVGMLVTTLPARVSIDDGASPADWLRAIQDRQLAVRDHEDAALVDIQRWSELPAGAPLFDSILVVENFPDYQPPDDPDALAVTGRRYRVQSNYPLSVIVLPGPELTLKAVYDPDQFDADVVDRLLDQAEQAIDALVGETAATVGELPLVDDDEVDELRGAATGDPLATAPGDVPDLIAERIRTTPEATAVVCGDRRLDYRRLGEEADRLAAALDDAGVGRGDVVAVMAERSPDLVVALVGVHRAGAAYLPLDPTYPEDRLRFMLDDAGAVALVHTEATAEPARVLIGEPGELVRPIDPQPVDGTGLVVRPTPSGAAAGAEADVEGNPAYLIYTSGSTGRPNGVVVDHDQLAWSTAARAQAYDHQPGAFLLLSSFAFDSSIVGLFWTLTSGGTLVLPRPGEELDVRALARLIEHHGVTHTLCLPSLYALVIEHAPRRSLATLSTVIVAGEACPPALVSAHGAALPGTELHNEYGPTEAAVWCTSARLDIPSTGAGPVGVGTGPVPIGRPAPGAVVAVLDRRGRPAGVGVTGEIHVGGAGLTAGYHRRPDRTAARFVTRAGRRWFRTGDLGTVDADGVLWFHGRLDSQVKVRGHRVELGEVERVLADHPAVVETAALVDGGPGGEDARPASVGARLVAVVEVGADGPADGPNDRAAASLPGELQAWMADRLPDAFVPSVIAVRATLPRLPNGKVDRRNLADLIATDQPSTTATTRATATGATTQPVTGRRPTAEATISGIWADLLPGVAFGPDDDFFDIGGHSLLAVALVERLRRATGIDLPLSALLETPTVAALAARVEPEPAAAPTTATRAGVSPTASSPGRTRAADSCLVTLRAEGSRVPLYLIPPAAGTALSFRELAAATDPDQPLHCFEPVGTYGDREPHETVEAMAEHYLAELAAAQPDGRYRIGGSCLGAIVAWEMAARLERRGTPVELLVFLDPGPPHSGPTWSYQLPSQRSPRQLLATTWETVTNGQLLTAARAVWRRNSYDRIGRVHYRAQLQYVAERLKAPILWLESEELAGDKPEFLAQWRVLAGDDLTPIVVPETTHHGLMTGQPGEVRRLAAHFDRAMDAFEATGELPGPS